MVHQCLSITADSRFPLARISVVSGGLVGSGGLVASGAPSGAGGSGL